MTRWRTRRRGALHDRGAAAVEFAIVLVLLLIILFGIIDFGRLLFVSQSVKAASREGARVASIATATSTDIFNRTASAADSAQGLAGGGDTRIAADVCVTDSGTCATATPSFIPGTGGTAGWAARTTAPPSTTPCAGTTNTSVRITVDQPFLWFTPVGGLLGGFFTPGSVSGQTTMRCE